MTVAIDRPCRKCARATPHYVSSKGCVICAANRSRRKYAIVRDMEEPPLYLKASAKPISFAGSLS